MGSENIVHAPSPCASESALADLLARLEGLSGADRDVDEAVFGWANGRKRRVSTFEQYDPSEPLPAFTASIDAVVALVERVLPGWRWAVTRLGSELYAASLPDIYVEATTAPLALLRALVAAKIQEGK